MSGRLNQISLTIGFLARESMKFACRQPHFMAHLYTAAWYHSQQKKLPSIRAEELFPGIQNCSVELIGSLAQIPGGVWINELPILSGICQETKPKLVFEFGTFAGLTTVNLAANTPANSIIYTLDIPHDHPKLQSAPREEKYILKERAGQFYRESPYRHKVRQLWCDSAEFDESPFAGQVDLVFIDASHSYAYVKNDTEKSLRMLRKGGLLIWHDYYHGWPDVTRYLHERAKELRIQHIAETSLAIACADLRDVAHSNRSRRRAEPVPAGLAQRRD